MLYLIADQLGFPGGLNLIRYLTFRAGAAAITALVVASGASLPAPAWVSLLSFAVILAVKKWRGGVIGPTFAGVLCFGVLLALRAA